MDHASSDYSQTYADTFVLPPFEYDTGVYTLDEASRSTDLNADDYLRAPIRRYDAQRNNPIKCGGPFTCGETGVGTYHTRGSVSMPPRAHRAHSATRASGRESFAPGFPNHIEEKQAIFGVNWDERPMHYNPKAGEEWAHLIPSQQVRPAGGGPAMSLAFPTRDEERAQELWRAAQLARRKENFAENRMDGVDGAHPNCGCGAKCGSGRAGEMQTLKMFLLVIIVVLLAMTLAAANSISRGIDKTIKKAIKALSAAAQGATK